MPDQHENITLSELARNLDKLELRLNARLDSLEYVQKGAYEERMKYIERRLDGIEERMRWGSRAVVAAVLLTPISAFMTALLVTR